MGKKLQGRERLIEQAQVLEEIKAVCENEGIELVLIAGDVFDTYTPSAEAEELFYEKVKKIAGEERAVIIISGNHDDGVRLSAVAPLAEEQGIYVVGNARLGISCKETARKIKAIQSGKGYAIFTNDKGEQVYISMLPYPNEARFKEEKSELSYIERMQGWIAEGESAREAGMPSIFMAHVFIAGGKVSESEREIDLGGARAIPVSALPRTDYIALGHLHKKQRMGENCYYSGSPLQYAFDESADKSVKVFNLTQKGVEDLRDVPLKSGRKLVRLQAENVENALALLEEYKEAYVELTLILDAPLTKENSVKLTANENLVSLHTEVRATEEEILFSRKTLTDGELFDSFYDYLYKTEAKAELKSLFLSTINELEEGGES